MKRYSWGIIGAVLVLGTYISYQNCGNSNPGNTFNVGSASSNGPTISGITISQSVYSPGGAMMASAPVSDPSSPVTGCSWNIKDNSGTILNNFIAAFSNGTCVLPAGATAPTATGNYTLNLQVQDSAQLTATSSAGFQVQTGAMASPSPSASASASPTASPSAPPFQYQCPVLPSTGCSDTSRCQSNCVGQYTNSSTCTYYVQNAIATPVSCTPTNGTITSVYSCPLVYSSGCSDGSRCESTCTSQYQPDGTCTTYGANAVPTTVACSSMAGLGTEPLYLCPLQNSIGCSDASRCESNCLGQYSHQSTCTYYNANAVPSTLSCTPMGSFSF